MPKGPGGVILGRSDIGASSWPEPSGPARGWGFNFLTFLHLCRVAQCRSMSLYNCCNMPTCGNCSSEFSRRYNHPDGRERYCANRLFCFNCSPFGAHNTSRRPTAHKRVGKGERRSFTCEACGRQKNEHGRNNTCWPCRHSKSRAVKKQMAVQMLGGRCVRCGYDRSSRAFDFHHRDKASKSFTLSANWHRPWPAIEAEAKKCDLLCANCHREIEDDMAD